MRMILLLALILPIAHGCKFREPDPSAEIYLSAVAEVAARPPGNLRVGQAPVPVVPAQDPVARALMHAGPESGFDVTVEQRRWLFVPPSTAIELTASAGLAQLGDRCRARQDRVVVPCTDAERARADGLLRVMQGLHLHEVRTRARVTVLAPDRFRVGSGRPSVELTLAPDARVAGVWLDGEPALRALVTASRSQAPSADWNALFQSPPHGSRELLTQRPRPALCVSSTGGPSQVGDAVREVTDKASELRANVVDAAGVVMDQDGSTWRTCLILASPLAGAVTLVGGDYARQWHRKDYAQLLAQRGGLDAWMRQQGRRRAPERPIRITLYHDPSSTDPAELTSSLSIPAAR